MDRVEDSKQRSQHELTSTYILFPFVQCAERNGELQNKLGSEASEFLQVVCYLLTENQIWKLE